jgi:cyclopropane fatty-acyl-phospholipid synthase-like methyltransferase
MVGSNKYKNSFLEESLGSFTGNSVLDLGCGTGVAAKFVSDPVQYYGIDISEEYLKSVLQKKSNAIVHIGSISDREPYEAIQLGYQDVTLALGLFHHINDQEMMSCLDQLRNVMSPGSVLKSFDPVIDSSTSKVAAWVARNDRGQYLRTPDELCGIFEKFSLRAEYRVMRNVIRIPVDVVVCEVTAV